MPAHIRGRATIPTAQRIHRVAKRAIRLSESRGFTAALKPKGKASIF